MTGLRDVDTAAVIAASIEDSRREYEQSENPIWVWAALNQVLEYDVAMPHWIKQYLLDSSTLLIATAGDSSPSYVARVLAALGFQRRRGTDDMSEFHDHMQMLDRGISIYRRVVFLHESANKASEELEAKLGVDARRLREVWRRFQRLLAERDDSVAK